MSSKQHADRATTSRDYVGLNASCCPSNADVAIFHAPIDGSLPRRLLLVAVHGHALGAAAELSVGGGADRSAAVSLCASLLQCKQLLGTEGLVVDLGCALDEVLEVSTQQEVSQIDKLAVRLVLDINDSPSVLATADLVAIDDDVLLGTDNGEGDQVLGAQVSRCVASGSVFRGSQLTLICVLTARSSSSNSSFS